MNFIWDVDLHSSSVENGVDRPNILITTSQPASSSTSSSSYYENREDHQPTLVDSGPFYRTDFPGFDVSDIQNQLVFQHTFHQPVPPEDDGQLTSNQPKTFPHYSSLYLPDGIGWDLANDRDASIAPVLSSEDFRDPPAIALDHMATSNIANTSVQPSDSPRISDGSSGSSRKGLKRKLSSSDDSATEFILESEVEEFPPCTVCQDMSTGIHYGVWACEGCKGFFRRAMSRKPDEPTFSCGNGHQCTIDRDGRNKCRACRLRRCHDVGMVFAIKEAYKNGNLPNTDREQSTASGVSEVRQLANCIVSAHQASFSLHTATPRYTILSPVVFQHLKPSGGFQAVQHFATSLPLISCLSSELRTHLLETNAVDVVILRLTRRYRPERNSLIFPAGGEVTLACLSSWLGHTTVQRFASLCKSTFRLRIGTEELAFLCALALLSSNMVGSGFLPAQISLLRKVEVQVLASFQCTMPLRGEDKAIVLGKLLALLSDVQNLQRSAPMELWLKLSDLENSA